MASVLLCPGCGVGLPTRRRLRLHLATHGVAWERTHVLAEDAVRIARPIQWTCKSCRREFDSVRRLSFHVRDNHRFGLIGGSGACRTKRGPIEIAAPFPI